MRRVHAPSLCAASALHLCSCTALVRRAGAPRLCAALVCRVCVAFVFVPGVGVRRWCAALVCYVCVALVCRVGVPRLRWCAAVVCGGGVRRVLRLCSCTASVRGVGVWRWCAALVRRWRVAFSSRAHVSAFISCAHRQLRSAAVLIPALISVADLRQQQSFAQICRPWACLLVLADRPTYARR